MSKIEVPPSASKGMGFFGFLALVLTLGFVACKVMGWGIVAGWSWWTVFLPAILYVVVPLALVLTLWALFLLGAGIGLLGAVGYFSVCLLVKKIKRKFNRKK